MTFEYPACDGYVLFWSANCELRPERAEDFMLGIVRDELTTTRSNNKRFHVAPKLINSPILFLSVYPHLCGSH